MTNTYRKQFLPDRRQVLAGAGAVTGAALANSALSSRALGAAAIPSPRPPLIVVFLRGGADALSWVAPVEDAHYQLRRPSLKVPVPPTPGDRRWLKNALGQHRGLAVPEAGLDVPAGTVDMMVPFENGDLTFVVGSGFDCSAVPVGCALMKSHFEAMKHIETATNPGTALNSLGWLGRYLQAYSSTSPLRGLSHGPLLPQSLVGGPASVPVGDVANYPFPGRASTLVKRKQILTELNITSTEPSQLYLDAADNAVQAQALLDTNYPTLPKFPASPFGVALQNTATLLNGNVPIEAVHLNYASWDHHFQQGTNSPGGQFYLQAQDVSQALGAFYDAMGGTGGTHRYTMVLMSEFGRRAFENGDAGTDHGSGGVCMVMGAGVQQGKYAREVFFRHYKPFVTGTTNTGLRSPGLLLNFNTNDEDLAIGVDLRELLGEILVKRHALSTTAVFNPVLGSNAVFPGVGLPSGWHGIVN